MARLCLRIDWLLIDLVLLSGVIITLWILLSAPLGPVVMVSTVGLELYIICHLEMCRYDLLILIEKKDIYLYLE